MKNRFDIAVVGAGMVGLTVAALLARSAQAERLRITVFDAAPRPVFDPASDIGLRVSALSLGSAVLAKGKDFDFADPKGVTP